MLNQKPHNLFCMPIMDVTLIAGSAQAALYHMKAFT